MENRDSRVAASDGEPRQPSGGIRWRTETAWRHSFLTGGYTWGSGGGWRAAAQLMRHDTLSLLDTLGGAGGPAGAGRITDADLVKWANDKARAAGRPGPPISGLQVQARSPARPRAREAGMVTRQLSVWLPTLFTL